MNTRGLERLVKKLTRMPRAVQEIIEQETDRYGHELLKATIRHASGRPGPNIVSGQYVSSFRLEMKGSTAKVVNYSPQSARLEYGFIGTDSLGRSYAQPPFPHFRPALQEVGAEYKKAIITAPIRAWRRS
jgi:hypothetical protein